MADRNLGEIESEIEQTRARLAATIDELVYRTSPKTIARREMNQVKAYFVNADGSPRAENIAKVAGGVAGAVLVLVVIRKIVK